MPATSGPSGESPETVRLDVAGHAIHGAWLGPRRGRRPVLVFLHDGLGSVGTLRKFPARLADALGLPAFAYDRLGYGRSDEVDDFPDDFMGAEADRLEEVLDAAGIVDCCLVGHSDGGTVALLHGARHRGRVRAIVTIAAHVRRDRLTLGQVLRHQKMAEDGDVPDWMPRFHGERARRLMLLWAETWQRALYDDWDICAEIASIRAPLLALQGSGDAYGLPSQLEGIAAAVGHAETELVEGLGHFPHLEDAVHIVARIRDFLLPHCGESGAAAPSGAPRD